jgi:capsule polysaccharide export protein KpsE/RkpR
MLAVPMISILALTLSLLCISAIFVISARHKVKLSVLESQSQVNEQLLFDLQSTNDKLGAEIKLLLTKHEQVALENIQVSKQLEHRIKTLQKQMQDQHTTITQMQSGQSEDKFYARAIKLAKKGADLDEIVTECELPRAEVEMLLSVYRSSE